MLAGCGETDPVCCEGNLWQLEAILHDGSRGGGGYSLAHPHTFGQGSKSTLECLPPPCDYE